MSSAELHVPGFHDDSLRLPGNAPYTPRSMRAALTNDFLLLCRPEKSSHSDNITEDFMDMEFEPGSQGEREKCPTALMASLSLDIPREVQGAKETTRANLV
jgi:hypothetical protein